MATPDLDLQRQIFAKHFGEFAKSIIKNKLNPSKCCPLSGPPNYRYSHNLPSVVLLPENPPHKDPYACILCRRIMKVKTRTCPCHYYTDMNIRDQLLPQVHYVAMRHNEGRSISR